MSCHERNNTSASAPFRRRLRGSLLLGLLGILVLIGFSAAAVWRVRNTAEYSALFGRTPDKSNLCRALPELASWRRNWILARFLADPAEDVRGGAITAWERSSGVAVLAARIQSVLEDDRETPALRTKAGLALLGRTPPTPAALAFIRERSADPQFRHGCSRLVAVYWEMRLPHLSESEKQNVLKESMDEADDAHEALRELVRRRVSDFAAFREEFIARLATSQSASLRRHLTACLAALSGGMRGQSAEDWRQDAVPEATTSEFHAVEAEWASEIKPNYQIDEQHGVCGLMLGEGAGGYIAWLKGYDGTVDIGSARFSVFAPTDGAYTLWARVWLSDKCGNSFGIWLDEARLSNFEDYSSQLGRWYWLDLQPAGLALKAGFHQVRLEAWEDGVFIDKFALLPQGRGPTPQQEQPAVRWDPASLPSLSFTPEFQAQARGTTQRVVVRVRRNTPRLEEGTLDIEVPPPFELQGTRQVALRFEKGNPLARTSFFLHLPKTAVGYEGTLRACYRDRQGQTIDGEMILTAQFDWLTSGPLAPGSPLQAQLTRGPGALPADTDPTIWRPYPVTGLDPYRRLDPERAFGQLQNCFLYFKTVIEVAADGTYLGLLTADDWARVWLDGNEVIAQPYGGPGEGRLIRKPIRIGAGRHRLMAELYQADFADPVGPDADRHTYNNCNFSFLLRKSLHEPAPEIRGLPRQ